MIDQLKIFGIFVVIGVVSALLFYLAGLFTAKIKKRKAQIAAESILLSLLFCAACAAFFCAMLFYAAGVFRFYMLAAIMFGFALTYFLQTKIVAKICKLIYNTGNVRK